MNELILILMEFGGGKGGTPNNDVVRFLLAAFFWAILFFISSREWHRQYKRRDLNVALAALLGLCRELLMFTAEYGSSRGLVSFDCMYHYYPPLEHAASMLSCIVIAFAFLQQVRINSLFTEWFLRVATAITLIIYLITTVDWQRFLAAHPGSSFGFYGGDMAFRVAASCFMATALAAFCSAKRSGRFVPTLLLTGFAFFFLDEFLMILNLATHERYVAIFAPIRHNLHIWAIPLLAGTYWSELHHRIKEAGNFAYAVIDALSAHICVLDDKGTIISINRAWRETDIVGASLGVSLQEGSNYLEICEHAYTRLNEHAATVATGIRMVIEGTRSEFIHKYPIIGPKETRWIMAQVTRLTKLNTSYVVISHEDITERKRSKEALRASEERYRTLVDNLPLGVNLIDNQHRIIMANKTGADWFRQTPESLAGRFCYEQFEKREHTCHHCPGVISMKTGDTATVDTEGIRNDGSRFSARIHSVPLFDDDGGSTGFVEVVEDITERKRAEEALQYSKARLLESQRVANIGHYEYYVISGHWTNSQELDKIFGIDEEYTKDVQGWMQIVHPEDREEMTDYLSREVIGKRQSFNRQYRIQRICDQTTRWVHGLGQLEFGDDGSLLQMFGTIQDITEWKLAEQQRQKLEEQMRHAQKLESLGVLAGGIAHDFNNILMAILGHAELAMMRLNPASPIRDNLLKIEKSAQRAAELSNQMLAYSGKGKFIVKAIDLGDLVTEMTQMLEVSISKKAEMSFNLASNLPQVEADSTQLRQVLMNLVINASEAIGDNNGAIAISTGAIHCDRKYLDQAMINEQLDEGLYVYVEVTDTGCGMDPETMSRIFDPFFTTKFTGRGLGMAAVMGIVRGHHGAIKVCSEPGRGSTFKMLLPAAAGHTEELHGIVAEKQLWHGSGTIMLVDDEDSIRTLGSEMLEMLGFRVLIAEDGQQAVEIYQKHSREIDVVILDLTMPNMDGEEAFRKLRGIKEDVRVIMSSGYNEQEINQRFLGKRLAGFIQKPYKLNELRTALRQALLNH